jgi:hypothetical protein
MMRQERALDTNDMADIVRYLTELIGYVDTDELLAASIKEKRVGDLQTLVEKLDALVDDRTF